MTSSPRSSSDSSSAHEQGLDLAVHGTLSADEALRDWSHASSKRGRWRMLAILLVCASPVLASYFTYYVIRPEGRTNFGELIEPMRSIPANLMATQLDGHALPLESLRHQWLLVSVAGGACDAQCENHLYFQRQLRESMGKDKDRMDWVWLISDQQDVAPHVQQALMNPGAVAARVDASLLADWLQPAAGQRLEDHLYVVDPMGNWMMRFPSGISLENASLFGKDLTKLLRASRFWDQAGRPLVAPGVDDGQ